MLQPTETGNNSRSTGWSCKLCLFDPDLSHSDENHILTSILFTGDGCFISLFNKETNFLVALLHYQFDLLPGQVFTESGSDLYRLSLEQVFKELNDKHLPLNNVRLVYYSERNVIIPGAYYKTDDGEKYYLLNYHLNTGELIKNQYIRNLDAYNVYGLPAVIASFARVHFKDSPVLSANGLLINNLLKGRTLDSPLEVYLHSYSNSLKIFVLNEDNLLYCNDFAIHTAEDAAYYAVFVANQLKPEQDTPVWLTGNFTQGSKVHRLISNYLGSTGFPAMPGEIKLSPALSDISFSRYFIILTVSTCA